MADGKDEFEAQLRALGHEPRREGKGMTSFPYVVPAGKLAGTSVRLAFDVPMDFDRTPPSGPHLSPRALPMNPGAAGHPERVADSALGPDWQYLSRPYPDWGTRGRSVECYMAFIRHLFATT